jgi:hypothetical protein
LGGLQLIYHFIIIGNQLELKFPGLKLKVTAEFCVDIFSTVDGIVLLL